MEKHHTTESHVELAIDYAIEESWNTKEKSKLMHIFTGMTNKPKITYFISMLVGRLSRCDENSPI